MTTDTFYIKRGDTSPAIRFELEPKTTNLTGATVKFQMRARNGEVTLIDRAATVVVPTGTPTVQYNWQAGDTNVAGLYDAEFRVVYSDGSIETFPNSYFIPVRIEGDVP